MIGTITSSRSRGLLFEGKFSFQRSAVGSVIDGIFFKSDFRDSVVPKHANFEPKRIFFLDLCIQSNNVDYRQILTAVVHLSFMYVFILIFVNPRVAPNKSLKPRTNGRNIVGHQLPTLLDVTCCVRLHTPSVACCCVLLWVVAQSLKPVKRLATCKRTQQFPTLRANNVGSCCVRLHVA